jgi:hypothetical protein
MSELVDEVVKRGVDKELIISRLRHWVREGLIVPVGEHHPGSGRRRYFEDTALGIALALNDLADFNLPIGVLRSAALKLRKALKHPQSAPRFLTIRLEPNGKFSASLYDDYHEAIGHSGGSIVLHLTKN